MEFVISEEMNADEIMTVQMTRNAALTVVKMIASPKTPSTNMVHYYFFIPLKLMFSFSSMHFLSAEGHFFMTPRDVFQGKGGIFRMQF